MVREIELLAPAKSAEHGIEAISHGADAVYIGAPQFSARANASNSIEEIEQLVRFAHQYYAKVYVALNTILTDEELIQAERLIHQLYNIGTDALIVQDMGITQLNLPPIPLHASTQMDNRTVEKVQFLQEAGFEQVVLARELPLDTIKEIHQKCHVKLEGFVHGALCVCYSGQCYLSQHLCGRSANRGVCAQLCRLPYSLVDCEGNILVKNKHLLSLKDFNLSNHLKDLIDAGVSSLKIEGRLKDIAYVKNVTAYYRQKIDAILAENPNYQSSSSGRCQYFFTPNIEKSFHRGSTSYFLYGRGDDITSFNTAKSLGERIGTIEKCDGKSIIVKTSETLNNGDGFCFLNNKGDFSGFKANVVEGKKIFPAERIHIEPSTLLYRNFDQAFEKSLSKKSAERKIAAKISLTEEDDNLIFSIIDEDNNRVSLPFEGEKTLANDANKQKENLIRNLQKSGDTIFCIDDILIQTSQTYFFPAALISSIRRELTSQLSIIREENRKNCSLVFPETSHPYISSQLDYRANIHNQKARRFYQKHQVEQMENSFESSKIQKAELMRCKHCIRYALGYCTKTSSKLLKAPLYLESNTGQQLLLSFDCKNCEMIVSEAK